MENEDERNRRAAEVAVADGAGLADAASPRVRDLTRAARIRDIRRGRGRTQEAFAEELGVSKRTVQTWEKGQPLSWRNARAIGRLAGVSPFSLTDDRPVSDEYVDPLDGRIADVRRRLDELQEGQEALAEQLEQLLLAVRGLAQQVRSQPPRVGGARRRRTTDATRSPGEDG